MRRRLVSLSVALAATGTLFVPGLASADAGSAVVANAHTSAAVSPTLIQTKAIHTKSTRTLAVSYEVQQTGYWCGPAATRIAISARMSPPSQATLAAQLGTTVNGTDDISQVTGVLNANIGTGWYETKRMPNDPPTQAQRDLLWRDIVLDIDNNYPLVTNIVAPPGNQPPGYPSDQTIYHYFTVIGYDSDNSTVLIADPASFGGNQIYWLTFNQLATLIPPKGYSA